MPSGFINWAILGNPVNWLIVTLTALFLAYAAFTIHANANSLLLKI
jgi:hypothetical protein